MTTQDIKQLFSYNTWANNRIFEVVSQLSPVQYFQDLKSSYGGVHGTLTHILGAHKIWLERWLGKTDLKLLKGEDCNLPLGRLGILQRYLFLAAERF